MTRIPPTPATPSNNTAIKPRPKIKIACSIDFDAVSGWLGTGADPANSTADYSAGYFSGLIGVPRLLRVLRRLDLADRVTWCVPGHSLETFPAAARAIAASGAEIALHGYAHESARQLTAEQERDVLRRCIELVEGLEEATEGDGGEGERRSGQIGRPKRKVRGYRAPLYQLTERTIALLQEHDFLWDSSLSHHDSSPYFLPLNPSPIVPISFDPAARAADWMHPAPDFAALPKSRLVEIPVNWYTEDATPLQFYPHTPNSAGYVDVRVIERMWMDRFEWLRSEIADGRDDMVIFGIVLHPDTAGMAHIIGMVERFLKWLKDFGDEVEFLQYWQIAEEYREQQRVTKTGSSIASGS